MSAKSPVALILGAGANIGQAAGRLFAARGYKVALAARSVDATKSTETQINIPSDFSKSQDVVNAFQKVQQTFGSPPSVVIYNVSSSSLSPPTDPFALPMADFERDLAINVTNSFVAAQQAVSGFAQLPDTAARTFIYTGNILNKEIIPRFISQGMGKSAGAHMIWQAAEAYKDQGFKFYYVDERKEDGSAKYRVDGEAHADLFWKLAEEDTTQGPWLQTFVKGKGYVALYNDGKA